MPSPENEYQFDRNAFKIMSFEEVDNYMRNIKNIHGRKGFQSLCILQV